MADIAEITPEVKVPPTYPGLHKAQGIKPAQASASTAAPAPPEQQVAPIETPAAQAPIETPAPTEAPKTISFKDLDEKTKLKEINEALGTTYKTLEEARPKVVKSKEEVEAEKETRKQKSLEWALGTGKIKKEDYEKSIVLKSKTTRDIALQVFTEELRDEDPKITSEEASERFKDYYREEEDENSPLRKRSVKDMERVASNYLKTHTSAVDTLDTEYEAFEVAEQRATQYGQKVKSVVEEMPKELSFSVPYVGMDGKEVQLEYKYPLSESDIKAIKKDFLTAEMYKALGADANDVKDSDLAEEISDYISNKRRKDILLKIVEEHGAKVAKDVEAHYRAIPNTVANPITGTQIAQAEKKTPPTYPGLHKALKSHKN